MKTKLSLYLPMLALVAITAMVSLGFPPPRMASAAEPRPVSASVTKDWASLADGVGASQDVTVGPSVALGDYCVASMSLDVQGIVVSCSVKAANTATVRLQNETAGTIDLASGTLRVMVFRKQPLGG